VSSLSEISVVQGPFPEPDGSADRSPRAATMSAWSPVDVPRARRPTPTTLVLLASCAGVGAIALGALAGVSTLSRSHSSAPSQATTAPATTSTPTSSAEKQALALLAKPSTARIVFRGSNGRLLLAVGSGGRAAILIRGLEQAAPGQPYYAWIVGSGRAVRAARFNGMERAVFLDVPLGPHQSVVVATSRPTSVRPRSQIVAARS
jgi:hypothetical protein